jgi:hypothetical protein
MLFKTIYDFKPKVIITMGAPALQSIIELEWGRNIGALSRWIGFTIPSPIAGCWVCPTYHPSFINRMNEDVTLVKIFKDHVQSAMDVMDKPFETLNARDMRESVEIITSKSRAKRAIERLNVGSGLLAFDYETNALKPEVDGRRIVSVSFCNGKRTFACMFSDEIMPAISKVLRNKSLKKVASNLKFEDRWTRAVFGHGVIGWKWDTMLASHVLNNQTGVCSLKFQAYVRYGLGDYESEVAGHLKADKRGFNKITKLDPDVLLKYNGMDSMLTYRMAKDQMREIKC